MPSTNTIELGIKAIRDYSVYTQFVSLDINQFITNDNVIIIVNQCPLLKKINIHGRIDKRINKQTNMFHRQELNVENLKAVIEGIIL